MIDLFLLGPGSGVAVGLLAVATLEMVRRKVGVRRDYELLYSLGVVFAAYAAAEAAHGSGFLAAFTAGLTISALDVELCDCFLEYGETTAEMALLLTFVLFGSSLIWRGFTIMNGMTLLFALVVLLVRPIAFLLSLAKTSLDRRSRLLIAWFGPRGLSSLLLALLPIFAGIPGSEQLFAICCLVVLLSIVVHGGSLMVLGRRDGTMEHEQQGTRAFQTPSSAVPSDGQSSSGEYFSNERISIDEVRRLRQAAEPVIVLDVRTERTYDESELQAKDAVRLPPDRAAERASQLDLPRNTWLVVMCACPSEETSGRVTQELRQKGWLKARALIGGWADWQAAGMPVEAKR